MKYRSNSILAYIPQNDQGKALLNHALEIHNSLAMRIFIMDILKSAKLFPQRLQAKKLIECQREETGKLESFVKAATGKEIPHEVILRIRWGNVVNTLIKESQKGGYEFVIIDKHQGKRSGSLRKKSIDKFISKSHCPVLTLNSSQPVQKVKKIVIPIDVSQTTKKRLYWATFFANQLKAKVQIVSALNVNIEETKSLAYRNAKKLKEMLEDRGVECDVKILKTGYQSKIEAILEYINAEKPELVIIRTHQEYRFSGRMIGSFVSDVIHRCSMPVFTVGGTTQNITMEKVGLHKHINSR